MSGNRTASDANPWLIKLWQSVQDGYCGPESMTKDRYAQLRIEKPMHPDTAFAGFGCSFGAKWFAGFTLKLFLVTKKSLEKSIDKIQNVKFECCSYEKHNPSNMLIYCDPPYANTTSLRAVRGFDHAKFWETMRIWSRNNIVVISEYKAPPDFECVLEMETRLSVRSKNGCEKRVEKLFRLRS
jgi:DNA adenine methylase